MKGNKKQLTILRKDRDLKILSGDNGLSWLSEKGLLCSVILSILSFLIVYGVTPLNVTNDNWIMAGYSNETDIICHYTGWVAFRNSDWTYPLGVASCLGYPNGSIISFTDSLPWIAMFFKLFTNILPDTFQYFGIYVLLCFVLQGIAGYKIVYKLTQNIKYSVTSSILFVFAPVFLERTFRHTGLGSQWLILFSFLLYLYHRDDYKTKHYVGYLILLLLAIGIHPYFLPMIAVFLLLCTIADVFRRKYISIVYFLNSLGITYVAGCMIGTLGAGVPSTRGGYGYYNMNLNALINPTCIGGYTWSTIIKIRPQILGNYDGFNYLGFGMIAGIVTLAIVLVLQKKWIYVISTIKKEWLYVVAMLCCTIFAISNVVTLNGRVIAEIPIPDIIAELCGIFRASSRIFYPVYYSIFVGVIYALWKYRIILTEKTVFSLLVVLIIFQIVDMHDCILEKHQGMYNNSQYQSALSDERLSEIADNKKNLILDSFIGDANRSIGVWGGKNKLNMYFTSAISGDYTETYEKGSEILEYIKQTGDIGKNIIVTSDRNIAEQYLQIPDIGCYVYNLDYYLADINTSEYLTKTIP